MKLEYENAPSGVELPKVVEVNAGHKLVLPEIYGYDIVILDDFGKEITGEIIVKKNMKLKVKLLQIDYEKDTDRDGFPDYFERIISTDPNKIDTDGDGITDYEEHLVSNPLIYDRNDDVDNDAISNYDEIKVHKTSPLYPDSDFDCLSDYDEINRYATNPNDGDADKDGVIDGIEVENGLNPTVSNKGQSIDKKIERTSTLDGNVKLILETKIPVEELNSIMVTPLYEDDSIVPKTSVGYIDKSQQI